MRNIITNVIRRNRNRYLPKEYTNDADFLDKYGMSDTKQPYDMPSHLRRKTIKQTKLGE